MPENNLKRRINLALLVIFALVLIALGHAYADDANNNAADPIVGQMRGMSMRMHPAASDGAPVDNEQRRQEIVMKLRKLGADAIPSLAHALADPDVQMRRNADLALIYLSSASSPDAKDNIDIRQALPALIKATEDNDKDVRAWSAGAIANIGPYARDAIPALIKLLKDPQEGPRNVSCIALGSIGPSAQDALPALKEALNDPSTDVRKFAQQAIEKIQ